MHARSRREAGARSAGGRPARRWRRWGDGGGSTLASGALQGSAAAGGAGPVATMSPTASADTADTDTIRGTGDTSHLSVGQNIPHRRQRATDVTIVIKEVFVISGVPTGTDL
ncbi:hypothetical protein I553_2931 [Mycobacterium xenopi 4042]|uniref:Uncharacterized protein n=1 Tax=Mycobacterium xenopi 4042 TaxID=1299334 RepID=X8EEL9_MYCXE|nr:hypothetical protein I553_2931 [Mycobacterium xenopi 4042]